MRKLELKSSNVLRVIHAGPATGKETARTVINLLGGSMILLEEIIQAVDPEYYENRLWRFPEHAERGMQVTQDACETCVAMLQDNPRAILVIHCWDDFIKTHLDPILHEGKVDLTVHHTNALHLHWKLAKRSPSLKPVTHRQCQFWVRKWLTEWSTFAHARARINAMDAGLLDVLIVSDVLSVTNITDDLVQQSKFRYESFQG